MGHFSRLNPFGTPAPAPASERETPKGKARSTETTSNHTPKILKDWAAPCSPLITTSKQTFDSPPERPPPPSTSLYDDHSASVYQDFDSVGSPSFYRPTPTSRFLDQQQGRSNLPQSPSIKSLNARLSGKKSSSSPSILKSSSIADLRSASKGKSKAEITLDSAVEEEAEGEAADVSEESKQRKRSGSLKDMMKAFGRRMSSGERDRPGLPTPSEPVPNLPISLRAPAMPTSNSIASFSALNREGSSPQSEDTVFANNTGGAAYQLKKGILRELQAPGSGHSVRFFSRDQFKIITPNTTADMSWADGLDNSGGYADTSQDETPLEGKESDAEHVGLGKPSFLTRLQAIAVPDSSFHAEGAQSQSERKFTGSLRRDYVFPVDDSAHIDSVFGGGLAHQNSPARSDSHFLNQSSVDMDMAGRGNEDMSNLMDASNPFLTVRPRGSEATLRAAISSHSDESSDLFEFCDSGRTPRPLHNAEDRDRDRGSTSPTGHTAQQDQTSVVLGVVRLSDEANASYWSADSSDGRSSRRSLDDNASDASSHRSTGTVVVHDRYSINSAQDVSSPAEVSLQQLGQAASSSAAHPDRTDDEMNGSRIPDMGPALVTTVTSLVPEASATIDQGSLAPMLADHSDSPNKAQPLTPARGEKTVYLTPMNTLADIMPRFSPMSDVDSSPSRSGSSCHSPLDLSVALRSMADTVSAAQSEHVEMVVRSRDQYQALCEKLKGKIVDLKGAGKRAQQEIASLRRVVQDTALGDASQDEKVQMVQAQFSSLEHQIQESLNAAMWESVEEDQGKASGQAMMASDNRVLAQLEQARMDLKDSAIRIEAMFREQMQLEDRATRWENKHLLARRRTSELERANAELLQRTRDLEIRSSAVPQSAEEGISHRAVHELADLKAITRAQMELQERREQDLRDKVGMLQEQVLQLKETITLSNQATANADAAHLALQHQHEQTVEEHAQIQRMLEIAQRATEESTAEDIVQLQAQLNAARKEEIESQEVVGDLRTSLTQANSDLRAREDQLKIAESNYRELHAELIGVEEAFAGQASVRKRELQQVYQELQRESEALRAMELEGANYRKDLSKTLQKLAAAEAAHLELLASRESLEAEIDSLRRQNASLRQDSAAKDLQIMQLSKTKDQLKDDKEMLNIAIDSKQQEIEIIKRRYSIKHGSSVTPSTTRPVSFPSESSMTTPAHGRQAISGLPARGPLATSRMSGAYQTPAPAGQTYARKSSTAASVVSDNAKARQPLGATMRDNSRATPSSPSRSRPVSATLHAAKEDLLATPSKRNSSDTENPSSIPHDTPVATKSAGRTATSRPRTMETAY